MRNNSGNIFVKLIMVIIICSFGLWGMGNVLAPSASNTVAKIGEYEITVDEYNARINQEIMRLRSFLNMEIPNETIIKSISAYVLEDLVQNKLIRNEADELDLIVGDDYVLSLIVSDFKFRGANDAFSKEIFKRFLKRNRISEKQYIEIIKDATLKQIVLERIAGVSYIPKTVSENIYNYEYEKKQVDVIKVPLSLITDVSQPNDAELVQFYQDNRANYQTEEKRKFTYLMWNSQIIAKGLVLKDEELQEYYDENIADFTTAEKRELQNIVVSSEEKAEEIYNKIKEGGDFAEIAKTTLSLSDETINMGFLEEKDVFDEDIAVQLFALEKGQISQPMESDFGWHIFKIADVKPSKIMPFDVVKDQIIATLSANKAEEKVYELGNEIEDAIAGGLSFEEIAKEYGIEAKQIASTMANEENIPEDILKTAFDTEEESELLARNDGGYAIVRVDAIDIKREKALDSVRGLVSEDWTKAEIKKKTRELAELKVKEFLDGKITISAIEKQLGEKFQQVELNRNNLADGYPISFQKEIFTLDKEQSAIASQFDNDGNYIIGILVDTPKLEIDEKKMDAVLNNLKMQQQQEIIFQYFENYLKKKYTIEIFI